MLAEVKSGSGIDIESIKQRDLTEYLTHQGLELKRSGPDTWQALCPLHDDHHPSFNVSFKDGIWLWHCFGCNQGGSIIDYVMQKESISFKEALFRLSAASIIPLQSSKTKSINPVLRKKLLQNVMKHYHEKTFLADKRGQQYLRDVRGITDSTIYETFQIGFCNGTLYQVIPKAGEQIEQLKQIGILRLDGREFFEDCVVFPLRDEAGDIVSLYGRKIHQVQHLYLKGMHQGLFNSHILKTYTEIILVESIIDALSVYQMGIKNIIPLYGVHGLTQDHIEAFKKNNTQSIILLMDGDEAGKKATIELQPKIESLKINCRIAELPDQEDPNSFMLKYSPEDLKKIIDPEIRSASVSINSKIYKESILDGFKIQYARRIYEIRGIEKSRRSLKANIKAISTDSTLTPLIYTTPSPDHY